MKMSTEKATQAIPCSTPGSPNTAEGATSLQELRSQIAAQAGRLILVSEKKHSNGYSVYYQVLPMHHLHVAPVLHTKQRRGSEPHETQRPAPRQKANTRTIACHFLRAAGGQQRKHLPEILRRSAAAVATALQKGRSPWS